MSGEWRHDCHSERSEESLLSFSSKEEEGFFASLRMTVMVPLATRRLSPAEDFF